METTKRKQTTIRLPEYAIADIREVAKRQNQSINGLLVRYILDGLYRQPNETTLAAMRECESGVELDELTSYDIEHLEEYIAKL